MEHPLIDQWLIETMWVAEKTEELRRARGAERVNDAPKRMVVRAASVQRYAKAKEA